MEHSLPITILNGMVNKTQKAQEQTLGVTKNNIYQKKAPTPRAASNAQKKTKSGLRRPFEVTQKPIQ